MGYWDCRGAANQAVEEFLHGLKRSRFLHPEPPSEWFAGVWSERHRFNVPGPFYGAETDTCCCGPLEAPDNVLVDDLGMEFIWRQPQDPAQLTQVISAAWCDPFSGYGWDGDAYWTTEAIRDWWADRGEISEWVDRQLRDRTLTSSAYSQDRATTASLRQFRSYFSTSLDSDLREYLFFVEEHRSASDGELLPLLTR
jgi:hypothetical protein